MKSFNLTILVLNFVILLTAAAVNGQNVGTTANAEIQNLTAQINADPEKKNRELYFKRANAYCKAGIFDKGIADYDKVIGTTAAMGLIYKSRAECRLKSGDKSGALKDWEKAGYAYYGKKDYNGYVSSTGAFSRMLEIDPQNQIAFMGRGLAGYELTVLTDGVMGKETIADLTKSINLTADNGVRSMGYYYRGKAHFDQKLFDKAIEDFSSAVRLSPKVAKLYAERAIAYRRTGQAELAAADQAKYDLYNFEPRFQTASQYSKQNKYDLAITEYTKILEIDDRYVDAYDRRGGTYIILGKWDLALNDFSKAIQFDPKQANLYRARAQVYEKLNHEKAAVLDLTKSLELEPNGMQPTANSVALIVNSDGCVVECAAGDAGR